MRGATMTKPTRTRALLPSPVSSEMRRVACVDGAIRDNTTVIARGADVTWTDDPPALDRRLGFGDDVPVEGFHRADFPEFIERGDSMAESNERRSLGPFANRPLPRRIGRWIKYLPERMAHSGRRTDLWERLRGGGPPRSVLVICYGNICRSPYAAHRIREWSRPIWPETVRIDSAGFVGHDRPSPTEAQVIAKERGVELDAHRSAQLHPELARGYDLVIVMEAYQRSDFLDRVRIDPSRVILLGDIDPHPIDTRAIVDPYGKDTETFAWVYERIDRCVDHLLSALDPRYEFIDRTEPETGAVEDRGEAP